MDVRASAAALPPNMSSNRPAVTAANGNPCRPPCGSKDRPALRCEPEAKKARALLDRMAAELSLLQRIKGVQGRNEADGSTVRLKFGSLLSDRKLVEKHRLRVRARWYALPKFPYIAGHGPAIVSAG